jgi:hypothetical protein
VKRSWVRVAAIGWIHSGTDFFISEILAVETRK